jgi:hypothetical protein
MGHPPCEFLNTESVGLCVDSGCSLTASLQPVAAGSGFYLGTIQLPGFATATGSCINNDCRESPPIIEVYPTITFSVDLGMAGTFYPGGQRSAGGLSDAQRMGALVQARKLAQGPMNVLTVVAGAEAAVPLIVAAPGVYATASEFANVGFGELIPQAGEFVDAATADFVIPRTAAALAGGAVTIVRQIACGIQNNRPWYCF